jgi:hypothetical protein
VTWRDDYCRATTRKGKRCAHKVAKPGMLCGPHSAQAHRRWVEGLLAKRTVPE